MKSIRGQSLTEYGLIMGLVALLCLPALLLLKDSMNGSITSMLPSSFKASTPTTVKLPQNGKPPNTPPNIQAGGDASNLPTVLAIGASDNPVVSQPISTAGSNGNSATVLANSSQLLVIAAKYSQTSPELSNSIVKLGQLGQQMGQAIANNDKTATNQIWSSFTDLYTQILILPSAYKQLSPEDQTLVKTLTNQSTLLSAEFADIKYTGLAGLDDYNGVPSHTAGNMAEQIQSNSTQTVQCGQNLSCN